MADGPAVLLTRCGRQGSQGGKAEPSRRAAGHISSFRLSFLRRSWRPVASDGGGWPDGRPWAAPWPPAELALARRARCELGRPAAAPVSGPKG
jgi:hypothetical protein